MFTPLACRKTLIPITMILLSCVRAGGQPEEAHAGETPGQSIRLAVTFASVQARVDSIAAMSALVLVAQREGDFASLLSEMAEKRVATLALQNELLLLIRQMDQKLARGGLDLAAYLVEPSIALKQADAESNLRVVLRFIETIPESLETFGAFCLSAGLMLEERDQHALASRYFERASASNFVLSTYALYLAMSAAAESHETDRALQIGGKLAVSSAPDYVKTKGKLLGAMTLLEAGRLREAEEHLQSLLESGLGARDRMKAVVAMGKLHEAAREYQKAAESYATAFGSGTDTEETIEAARAYLRLVKNGQAMKNAPRTLSAARRLLRAGLRSEARPTLEKLFGEGRDRVEAGWDLGRLYYRSRDYREAEKVFRELERLDRSRADSRAVVLWIARCERQLGKTEEALRLFRRVALAGRRIAHLDAAWELALELESLGRLDAAVETYDLLRKHSPDTELGRQAWWRKGLCEYKAGSIATAQSTFTSCLRGSQGDLGHDMALFWRLKCSVEGGAPISRAELVAEKARSDSLYGLLLESILGSVSLSTSVLESAGPDTALAKEIFKIPWVDLRRNAGGKRALGDFASGGRALARDTSHTFEVSAQSLDAERLFEDLPLEARRGAGLLQFGLRSLAVEELRACESKFSGDNDVLFLITQLYWRNGLYAAALSLSDRLLRSSQGVPQTEERFLERILYPICYADLLLPESKAQAVNPLLVLAVMKKESTFNASALSSAGARGLMQLMPETASAIASYLGEDKQRLDLMNPGLNIRYGVWQLGRLLARYSDSPVVALAAYNAGEDNAERWETASNSGDGFVYMESVSYRETRDYIRRVLSDFQVYRELYSP